MNFNRRVRVCSAALSLAAFWGFNVDAAKAATTESLFTAQTPALTNQSDGSNVNYELGMKFSSGVAGQITGVRFWKSSNETGTHTGHIWSSSGRLLAAVTFTNETGSGWQQQAFATPLTLSASTVYVVSVNTGKTYYSATDYGLSSQVVNQDLRSIVGHNAVYGAPGKFPTNTWESSNYFRDVVFVPGAATPTEQLSASATALSFGSIGVGSSASQTLTMTNSGTGSVNVSQVTAAGTGFSVSGATLPATIAAGQSVSMKVTFTPTAGGSDSGSVSVVSNATNSPSTIALSGSGIASTVQLTASASSLSFGNVLVGAKSAAQSLTLTNTGNSSVNLSQVSMTGAAFSTSGMSMPMTLAAGQSAAMAVTFAPSATGSASGSLSFTSNATNSPANVALSGAGVQPQISVVPGSISFGNVSVGVTNTQTVTISNPGTANLSVTQSLIGGTGLSLSGLSLPLTVAAGKSASFTVAFAPAAAGSITGSITLVSNAPNSPLSMALSGTGAASTLQLNANPGTLSFGSLTVGTNAIQGVKLTNSGNSSVSVSALSVSGAGFSVSGISLPVTIAAAQTATFNVSFTPTSAGSAVGSISVVSTATTAPAPITLSGTGVAVALHTAALNWVASTSSVAGYNVYRGGQSGGPYTVIDTSLVTIMNYTDSTVTSGQTYYYVVTAVDASGNESGYSNEAAAIIP
jgi:hypothetical protein